VVTVGAGHEQWVLDRTGRGTAGEREHECLRGPGPRTRTGRGTRTATTSATRRDAGTLIHAARLAGVPYDVAMDRRLAQKNVRTGLICAAVSVTAFGLSYLAAYAY